MGNFTDNEITILKLIDGKFIYSRKKLAPGMQNYPF